ncbi:MAG: RNA polymerase sigma factor [Planctomycetota bacterium]
MDDEDSTFLAAWMQAQPAVAAYALSRLRDPHAMDDVVQEVALAAQRSFPRYDADRPFINWVLSIAHYIIVDHHRAKRSNTTLESPEAERYLREASERRSGAIGERLVAMQECVGRLAPEHREMLSRHYIHGEGLASIAATMRKGHSAIKVSLHRLRQALRDCVRRTLARESQR